MLRGIATASLPGTRGGLRPPHVAAAATIGGLRGARQQAGSGGGGGGGGRGGGRTSREVTEFLEDAASPSGPVRGRGAGRGSGSYERFIKAHKETILTEEKKRFKTWTSWRESLREEEEEADLDEELTSEEQVYLGQMNENEEEGNEAGRRGRPQRGGRRGGRGGRDEGEDDSGSYFDWGDDGLFIPRMPERAGDGVGGGFTSDRVLAEDDLPLKVSKLLWRRLRLKARDMDQHVPVAWRRSKALRDGMAAARQRLAEGEGGGEAGGKGGEVDAKAARAEVKRLNAAQTVEAIEAELGRLIVEGKLDQQMAMGVGGGKALDDSRGQRVRRVAGAGGGEGEAAEGESSSSSEDDSSSDEEKGEGEEEADEEDEDEEDEFAHLDDWSRIHAQDLEEAIGDEIPTLDRQEEGFEVFREYAEQLIQAGGVIEYRFTLADQLDREVRLPLPLATKRTLRESLQQDQAAVAPAEQLVADGAAAGPGGEATGDKPPQYDAAKAFAWLALNKNPSIGEIQRKELSAAMAATLKKLQEEPNRVERMRARAQGGGGAGGGVGGGGGKGKGKPAAAAKAKAGGKGK